MMDEYLAAIDAGTGGVRCVIFDAKGSAVSQRYRELPAIYTPDGRAEQDPRRLIEGARDAVRGAIAQSGIDPARIAAVSTTGTQTTFAALDRDGRFLTRLILWQDARGTQMFPWMRGRMAERGLTEADLYRRTFRPMDPLLAGAKLLWLRENTPDLYDRIHRLANPQALLLRALGAEEVTVDPSDGGWWLSHDGVTLAPDPELIEIFGLNPGHFPRLCEAGTVVGRVTPEAAEKTGLRAGTPLIQGAVDQCCAALGAGNHGDPHMGTMCVGTAGVILTYSDEPVPDPLGRYYVLHWPGGGYASEIAVPVAASAFRWVRDMLVPPEACRDANPYARMDAEAAGIPIGAGGLCFLPHLAGSVYPVADDRIRGGWIGASLGTTRAALVRAALEGICYGMRQILEASGREFASIRLLGGAARSDLWNQMQADICGCPVETLSVPEASALGAAMIAACGAGLYPDIRSAVRGMARVKHRYAPDPDNTARYDTGYRAWLACVDGLRAQGFPALARVRAEAGGATPC